MIFVGRNKLDNIIIFTYFKLETFFFSYYNLYFFYKILFYFFSQYILLNNIFCCSQGWRQEIRKRKKIEEKNTMKPTKPSNPTQKLKTQYNSPTPQHKSKPQTSNLSKPNNHPNSPSPKPKSKPIKTFFFFLFFFFSLQLNLNGHKFVSIWFFIYLSMKGWIYHDKFMVSPLLIQFLQFS